MFIMDEWDAVFHMPFISQKERQEYLLFLKNLLKDQVYVELAYMTGILPIAKYSAASELNMFVEYNMATRERFSSYFGFSEEEVDKLTKMAKEIETTIFVKNGPSYAGIGVGGMGYTTFTIAGPTGEGLTSAKSFCRKRRCVLQDGLHIRMK